MEGNSRLILSPRVAEPYDGVSEYVSEKDTSGDSSIPTEKSSTFGRQHNLSIDSVKGRRVAQRLYTVFITDGVHGRNEMPEDILPKGVSRGSLEHLLFITLTVSIDYQRDADQLWAASRNAFENESTRYLFNPASVYETPQSKLIFDMQQAALSKKPRKDAWIWQTVALTFFKKWEGDPRNFMADCNWDALKILDRLSKDKHPRANGMALDYPYLRGAKISPLWLRMFRDNVGENRLRRLDEVPIPVDIHIARASFACGVVQGKFIGPLNEAFEQIRKVWFHSVKGLTVENRKMIALDVDEPLWHLSKYGCTKRDHSTGECPRYYQCEAREFCVNGSIIVRPNHVEIDT